LMPKNPSSPNNLFVFIHRFRLTRPWPRLPHPHSPHLTKDDTNFPRCIPLLIIFRNVPSLTAVQHNRPTSNAVE
jgi:hypothetical protein